ncbi:hypothetical protein REPUB_Repub02eG0122900 [Reevesia pubescens]
MMAEDWNNLWAKLALTDEEQSVVAIEKSWVEDTFERSGHCLVGKLMTKKMVNVEALKIVLSKVWKVSRSLDTKEEGDKMFLFYFGNKKEKDRVLLTQPWSFNKSLLVLSKMDGFSTPDAINMDWCSFWVQIHGLPFGLMNERVGIVIGESLGDVEEVETTTDNVAWGKFVRVRVHLNVHKPLRRVGRISLENGKNLVVSFKFEKFPDVCYACGCLDQQKSDCDLAFSMKKMTGGFSREYGAWLRAETPHFIPHKNDATVLGEEVVSGNQVQGVPNFGRIRLPNRDEICGQGGKKRGTTEGDKENQGNRENHGLALAGKSILNLQQDAALVNRLDLGSSGPIVLHGSASSTKGLPIDGPNKRRAEQQRTKKVNGVPLIISTETGLDSQTRRSSSIYYAVIAEGWGPLVQFKN